MARSMLLTLCFMKTGYARRAQSFGQGNGARDWEVENSGLRHTGVLKDAELGMSNLNQAMRDPALLADVARRLRHPEGRAELTKILANPSFQQEMKVLIEKNGVLRDFLTPQLYVKAEPSKPDSEQALQSLMLALNPQKLFRQAGVAARGATISRRARGAVMEASGEQAAEVEANSADAKASLEEKMAKWEASEEEQRSKTLGGNLPLIGMPGKPGRMTRTDQPKKMDAFDTGMAISGVILVPLTLAVLGFPFLVNNIDVSSVGPPPSA